MQKSIVTLQEQKLAGLSARTDNNNEMTAGAKIAPLVNRYFQENLSGKILNRKRPGTTICTYSEYESDYKGKYTYFIGEEIGNFEKLPEGFKVTKIPGQRYVKFTTDPGKRADISIETWQKIWNMSSEELGGERSYLTDFEVYDERAVDPKNSIIDIYIGIK